MKIALKLISLGMLLLAFQFHAFSAEKVLAVEEGRILVQLGRVPAYVELVMVQMPEAGAQRNAIRERLTGLLENQRVTVVYTDDFGHNPHGIPLVLIKKGSDYVNQTLIAEGLVAFKAPEGELGTYAKLLANAESRAKKQKVGIWANADAGDQPTVAAKDDQPKAKPAGKKASGRMPFAAELTGKYYYPAGDEALAGIHPNRLIEYRSEAAARKAGKVPAPKQAAVAANDGTEDSADAVFKQGEKMYAKAVNMPATSARDAAYGEAFKVLTEAVNRYSTLVEAKPNDAGLAEKLRRAMQLRYGAMKQRRA